jgi:tRNA nucleotidyltransferase (CCA-adding enzyme)
LSDFSELIQEHVPTEYQEILQQVAEIADRSGQGLVLVGGVVRDLHLGRRIQELDIMLDPPARPIVEELATLTGSKLVSHEAFHTFTLHLSFGSKLDVVTAREETYRAPAALPDVFPSKIEKDLKRRDFSVNAMAVWLNKNKFGSLLDPFQGEKDLNQGLIRVLHAMSFVDDPTRIFRAARFASRFNFRLEEETGALVEKAVKAKIPALLSPVRRRHEFEILLKEESPLPALKLLKKWGMLSFIHPDWDLQPAHLENMNSVPSSVGPTLLVHRLATWLKPWGADTAKMMMTDLSFEKKTKTDVLRYL